MTEKRRWGRPGGTDGEFDGLATQTVLGTWLVVSVVVCGAIWFRDRSLVLSTLSETRRYLEKVADVVKRKHTNFGGVLPNLPDGTSVDIQAALTYLEEKPFVYRVLIDRSKPGRSTSDYELIEQCVLSPAYPAQAIVVIHPMDTWGRTFRCMAVNNCEWLIYSCGPNGIDEAGLGDDIATSTAA